MISVYLGDDLLAAPPDEEAFLRISNPDLRIIYEDENLLLLDKPAGLLLPFGRPGDSQHPDLACTGVFYQKGEYRRKKKTLSRPHSATG